tara:strand:- start:99 stop:773 length:675 start_codon:yes stop_codon:yes gene_type:complete
MIIEICATTIKSVLNANRAGADRIELCSNYNVGGLTPSIEFIKEALNISKIPIHVLVRPRPGNFIYNSNEIDKMKKSIMSIMELGINGFVVGSIKLNGEIDDEFINDVRELTNSLDLTFHRSFDYLNNQKKSIDMLVDNGFSRILCSGNQSDAINGIQNLISLNKYSNNRIAIMPGGGINKENCLEFKNLGFKEIHLSGILKSESPNTLDSDLKTIEEIVSKTK